MRIYPNSLKSYRYCLIAASNLILGYSWRSFLILILFSSPQFISFVYMRSNACSPSSYVISNLSPAYSLNESVPKCHIVTIQELWFGIQIYGIWYVVCGQPVTSIDILPSTDVRIFDNRIRPPWSTTTGFIEHDMMTLMCEWMNHYKEYLRALISNPLCMGFCLQRLCFLWSA